MPLTGRPTTANGLIFAAIAHTSFVAAHASFDIVQGRSQRGLLFEAKSSLAPIRAALKGDTIKRREMTLRCDEYMEAKPC